MKQPGNYVHCISFNYRWVVHCKIIQWYSHIVGIDTISDLLISHKYVIFPYVSLQIAKVSMSFESMSSM